MADHKSVAPVVEEAQKREGKADKRLWAMCEGFEQMKAAHTGQLHRLIHIDETIQTTLRVVGQGKVPSFPASYLPCVLML